MFFHAAKEALSVRFLQAGVLAMLLVLGSGCDRGWLAYQQIELGRPLSPDHLLVREGHCEDQAKGWIEIAAGTMPLVLAWDSVGVILDAESNVMARRYMATACGYWGLFLTVAARSVMEVEVPLPPFGKFPRIRSITRNPPITLGEYLKLVEENIPVGRPSEPYSEYGTAMAFFTPLCGAFASLSPLGVCGLGDVLDKSPGAMNQGYDLRFRDEFGRCYRVSNLGGRRIRIESSSFFIIDPYQALHLFLSPHWRINTGIEEKQTKTKIEPGE